MSKIGRDGALLLQIVGSLVLASGAVGACGAEELSDDERGGAGEAGTSGHAGTGTGEAGEGGSAASGAGGTTTTGGNGGRGGSNGVSGGGGASGASAGEGGMAGSGGEGGTGDACGNGTLDASEACDDRNPAAGDGCFECAIEDGFECDDSEPSQCDDIDECTLGTDDCHEDAQCSNQPGTFGCECNEGFYGDGRECEPAVTSVAAGMKHSCASFGTGEVRCWGWNGVRQLGYADWHNIGDDETPGEAGLVNVGAFVKRVVAGGDFTCALLDGGALRCWGDNHAGQLGYGDSVETGGTASVARAEDLKLGGRVKDVSLGQNYACAILDTDNVRCWGASGFIGYGNNDSVGDDETPDTVSAVDVGGPVREIRSGFAHTCALLTTGNVRCWGDNQYGEIGYPNSDGFVGDDETPAMMGDIDVGGPVRSLAVGLYQTCVLLESGGLRCWGMLGWDAAGNEIKIGDDEPPSSRAAMNLDFEPSSLTMGYGGICFITQSGALRCIDVSNTPRISSDLEYLQVSRGDGHSCALLSENRVRCWGIGEDGRLGHAKTTDIATPDLAANIQLFPSPNGLRTYR